MKLINPCNSGSSVVLAAYADNTRTIATYTPAAQSVVAMTSDLDIVITPPSGSSKVVLNWSLFGESESTNDFTAFVVYRDVDGGGFSVLPNARDGSSNYYSITAMQALGVQTGVSPSSFPISIIDESPTVGGVATYRLYCASTASGTAGRFVLNSADGTPGSGIETGLSTCEGYVL